MSPGCSQFKDIDYSEMFAPGVNFTVVRMGLSGPPGQVLHLHQLDPISAFLNANLDERTSMERPLRYEQGGTRKWFSSLKMTHYGLQRAT